MTTKPHLILISLLCILLVSTIAQEQPKKCRKAITDSKKLIGTLKLKERDAIEIVGQATYTITALNSDESLVGTFVFTLAEAERQKIAQAVNKELRNVPLTFSQQEVVGQFHKLTECPVLKFDFPAIELEVAGAKMRWQRFTLNLKEDDNLPTLMLCTLARRISNGLDRRFNLRSFNQRLTCQPEKD